MLFSIKEENVECEYKWGFKKKKKNYILQLSCWKLTLYKLAVVIWGIEGSGRKLSC